MAGRNQHRAVGVMDLLTAAAEHYGASLLYYDADLDQAASITRQPSDSVAPRGSI
jgi:hypothetical protein